MEDAIGSGIAPLVFGIVISNCEYGRLLQVQHTQEVMQTDGFYDRHQVSSQWHSADVLLRRTVMRTGPAGHDFWQSKAASNTAVAYQKVELPALLLLDQFVINVLHCMKRRRISRS